MLDDRKFMMRPGYKFPSPMSYKQMCQQVNMEVQKVGSDAVRPKIRKTVLGKMRRWKVEGRRGRAHRA